MKLKFSKLMNKLNLKRLIKHLPTTLLGIIVLIALYFVYTKFLKEGFEVESGDFNPGSDTKLVMFYADWCGHCKKLKPVWDEAADDVNKTDTKMIKINCGNGTEDDEKLMKKYNIQGYPTIIKFINGKPSEYQGDRDADSFREMFKNSK
jgi:protein disulfide-isomerase-like protein